MPGLYLVMKPSAQTQAISWLNFPLTHPYFVTRCLRKIVFFARSGDLRRDGLLSAPICFLYVPSFSLYLPADISFSIPLTSTTLIFFPPDFLSGIDFPFTVSPYFNTSFTLTHFTLFLSVFVFLKISLLYLF